MCTKNFCILGKFVSKLFQQKSTNWKMFVSYSLWVVATMTLWKSVELKWHCVQRASSLVVAIAVKSGRTDIVCACKELFTFVWLLQYCNDAAKIGWTELTLCATDCKVHLQAKVKCGCSLFLLHLTRLKSFLAMAALFSEPFWRHSFATKLLLLLFTISQSQSQSHNL